MSNEFDPDKEYHQDQGIIDELLEDFPTRVAQIAAEATKLIQARDPNVDVEVRTGPKNDIQNVKEMLRENPHATRADLMKTVLEGTFVKETRDQRGASFNMEAFERQISGYAGAIINEGTHQINEEKAVEAIGQKLKDNFVQEYVEKNTQKPELQTPSQSY